ncbi:MAG: hypothetical protein DI536_20495 [Archangium gephyra]|uniref:Uncharacterized protein n=1 Tax=Archangium gephyra TaxID=48 RepID=A0A2W5UM99_9BACT|nr:MAG: hypothetical protein DI536_20495 [Archangium gephyra]
MAQRRSNLDVQTELKVRVTELEARVRWLERKLQRVEKVAKVKPAPVKPGPARPRCPGCFAEVPKHQRERTCIYCGFDFRAVKPFKPSRRR